MSAVIKNLRESQSITQKELADRVGVTQGAVSQWENGSAVPGTMLLLKIADVLGCTVDELLRGGRREN